MVCGMSKVKVKEGSMITVKAKESGMIIVKLEGGSIIPANPKEDKILVKLKEEVRLQ